MKNVSRSMPRRQELFCAIFVSFRFRINDDGFGYRGLYFSGSIGSRSRTNDVGRNVPVYRIYFGANKSRKKHACDTYAVSLLVPYVHMEKRFKRGHEHVRM